MKTTSLLLSILVILSACSQPSVDHADKTYIDGNFFAFFVLVTGFAPPASSLSFYRSRRLPIPFRLLPFTLAEGESPAKTGNPSRA